MKILILGYKGMLGHELVEVFKDKHELVLWDRDQIDISDEKDVEEKIEKLKPDVVINAAAYTAVDDAESNENLAYKVNGSAVGFIANTCKNINAILVHFSTDYVFDGKNKFGYKEDYPAGKSLNVYGESKALGEKLILDIEPRYYLIRTSWLFGKHGKNFIETMLRLAGENKEIKIVNDQFGSPTYAKDLAKKVRELIESQKSYGIYHITNSNVCNWYEFALKIFELASLNPITKSVKSAEFPTPAKRPNYSILINTKLFPLRSWEEALKDYLVETERIK